MRISDDRYTRDRMRLDLALRFIRHEARTQTIRSWTGLTEDRIRKLYRSYVLTADGDCAKRHRGKSPRQVSYFLRSPRMQQEAAVLASVSCLFGVVPSRAVPGGSRTLPSVVRGELLCQAFEAYRCLMPQARISFEHAVFLITAVSTGDELVLRSCPRCTALTVTDRYAMTPPYCRVCADPETPGDIMPPALSRVGSSASAPRSALATSRA